jgi:hypothetical protein
MTATAVLCCSLIAASALGGISAFTETFSSSTANWSSSSVYTPINYLPAGGPDGSAYGSTTLSFINNSAGDQPLILRAQSNFGSSSNNLFGDWTSATPNTFSFSVRHNGPAPVSFFARFTSGAAPGVVALVGPAANAGEWTTYSVTISPATNFTYEGSPALYSTFSNVQRVQIGVLIDASLAGQNGPFNFDIDNVAITPAPAGSALLLGAAGMLGARRRRA